MQSIPVKGAYLVAGESFRFKVGDPVEAKYPGTDTWKLGYVHQLASYRGREGYYVNWVLPLDAPSWVSRGGWQPGNCVRDAL